MHHLPSNPTLALQMVRIRHAEISAQAHSQRVRRQATRSVRRQHRSRR